MAEFKLDVVTPEKSIARDLMIDSVVIPGELGQLNALPGHVNLMTSLSAGSFAYRSNGQWTWAFLSGGFAQVRDGKITILAETMDLAHEIDLAQAELALENINSKAKKLGPSHVDYPQAMVEKKHAEARLELAKKHLK